MKKMKLFLVLILVNTLLFSCSSDDDNENQINVTGELIVNGKTFDLTKGFIIPNYTGTDPNIDQRRFYFILTNGDLLYSNSEFSYSDNITQLIDFNMYSSVQASGSVESTTYPIYNFSDPNFDFDNAFIDHSGVNTNVVIQNGNYVSSDYLSSDNMDGHATMSENNGIYTITFSYTNDQNTVTGTFTGSLADLN